MGNNIIDKFVRFLNAEEDALERDEVSTGEQDPGPAAGAPAETAAGTAGHKTTEEAKETPVRKDGVSTRTELINAIVNGLLALSHLNNHCRSLQLIIEGHPDAMTLQAITRHPDFEKELRRKISDAGIDLGRKWVWEIVPAAQPATVSGKIADFLFIALTYFNEVSVQLKITALKGELVQAEYILDSTDTIKTVYHIGRGVHPQLSSGPFHKNDIAIAEEATTTENTYINQHVSRAHACIVRKNNVFSLKVLHGGSIMNGSRTRIYRSGDFIDMTNPALEVALEHEDQIELGKSVYLHVAISNH